MNNKNCFSKSSMARWQMFISTKWPNWLRLSDSIGQSKRKPSHFYPPDAKQILNLQDVKGTAKPYQIKQFLKIVETLNLKMKG